MRAIPFFLSAAVLFTLMCVDMHTKAEKNNKDNIAAFVLLWAFCMVLTAKLYEWCHQETLEGFKDRFDEFLEHAESLTISNTAQIVGMHYSRFQLYDIYDSSLQSSTATTTAYIQRAIKAIQDSNAIPNNRHLAQLILEYAVEVHYIFLYEDTKKAAVLYCGIDSVQADKYVLPSKLPLDLLHKNSPVYWNQETARFELTAWNQHWRYQTGTTVKDKWLLRLSGPLNPKLLLLQ
jgi:hypothetical protein